MSEKDTKASPKDLLKKAVARTGFTIKRIPKATDSNAGYSNLDEETIILGFLKKINPEHKIAVDIGASDGVNMSNTHALYKSGWGGLAMEYDANKFASLSDAFRHYPGVNLAKTMVTPDNIVSLLRGASVPKNFGFLTLDIDGFDYYVLKSLLAEYRPALICAEINEKIPPPLKFTVKYEPGYWWAVNHFFGQSISQIGTLAKKHDYKIVGLEYNNVFLIPNEIGVGKSLSDVEAYEQGYLHRPDRLQKFPWNQDFEVLHTLSPSDAVKFLNTQFKKYAGKYELSA